MLNEDLESYLVFLLMRFNQTPDMTQSVLAMDFLESQQATGNKRIELLKEIGDKSLLFSGLFPGLAQKKLVSIDYFVDMGRTAYLTVSEIETTKGSELFAALSKEFQSLRLVLTEIKMI